MDPDLVDDPEGQRSSSSGSSSSAVASLRQPGARRPPRVVRVRAAVVLALVSGMVWAALAVGLLLRADRLDPADRSVERVADVAADDSSVESQGVARLVASMAPSVVALRALSPAGERRGSALVIRAGGHVLTNAHLVEGATAINLSATDGRSFDALVVGSDHEMDLAVLTVAGTGLVPAALDSSRELRAGEMTIVVGARHRPQGSLSVTTGVIAGLAQAVTVGGRRIYDVMTTDAVVRPEALGGPVLDRLGAVAGIITRAASTSPEADHEGVVIPVDRARQVAEQLVVHGRVAYPWLGLSGRDLGPGTVARYGVGRGTLVSSVERGGPADRGGLRAQDVITAVQAAPVATSDELTMLVRRHTPGDLIELTVVRSGTKRTVAVRLDRAPANPPPP